MTPASRPEVVAAIAGFRPRSVPEEAAWFARTVVEEACVANVPRTRALLFACSKLGAFGLSVGLELSPQVLLHTSVIERFCTQGASCLSPATRRTLRTNLRYVAGRVLPARGSPAPLSRERAKVPYSHSEMAAYMALADAQPTESRRMRATGLICLGAGAGLMGADLRSVAGTDVVSRSGGLVVEVAGTRPRVVPVLARYHDRLIKAAACAGERYVVGGHNPFRHNVTTPLISSLSGGVDLARLETARLRSTWLCACAEIIGLRAFMDAAGVTCSQRLGDLVATLPAPSEPEAVSLLGGGP